VWDDRGGDSFVIESNVINSEEDEFPFPHFDILTLLYHNKNRTLHYKIEDIICGK